MTVFNIETLNALGHRLYDHADYLYDHLDSITIMAANGMQTDLRLAGGVCHNFATLRFRIMEIAEKSLTQPPAATQRDLLDALSAAECVTVAPGAAHAPQGPSQRLS
jgi:hypothetical protein